MVAVYILCVILIITVQGTCQLPTTTEGIETSTEPEVITYSTVEPSTDPCLTATILNDDGGRSTECPLFYDTCDRYIIEDWYRVKLQSTGEDLLMPTSCVSMNRCGTTYPIWMNGTYPSISDGIVDIKTCISSFTSCCDVSDTIKVKNCSSFTVFYLKKAQGCNWRYCFGTTDYECAPRTTITTTSEPTVGSTTEAVPSTDPCLTATILNDDGGRSTECPLFYDTCDRYITEDWYRVKLQSTGEDLLMPTSCVSMNRCGTTHPMWMNGTYPSKADEIVNIKICVSTFQSCCDVSYTIKVKNCGNSMVFYLKKAQGCNWRYCFGTRNFQCASPTTPITRTNESTVGKPDSKRMSVDSLTIVAAVSITCVAIIMLAVGVFLIIKKKPKVNDISFNSTFPANTKYPK